MTSTQANRLSVVTMVLWFGAALALLLLLYFLSPILAPFVLAGILAYVANPVVDRLSRYRLPRVLAVTFVLLGLGLIFAGLAFIILPLLIDELGRLAARAPAAIEQINQRLLPWVSRHVDISLRLDATHLNKLLAGNWDVIQPVLSQLYTSIKIGGMVFFGVVINALLVPVVMFYLLLDWHGFIGRLAVFIPRRWQSRCQSMVHDIDAVLAQYLRGQILVMVLLALYYSTALWLADIPSALSVGLVTGLLVFIPYLGFATGFSLALLVAAIQFTGLSPIIAVLIIYGAGQLLESFLLTPYLVGDRIGLHPLAVIFGLLAFGQLFGFFGVLLALPLSAILAVAWREVRAAYLASRFYQHES
ncbi:MAG: AI-2E family transporter [Pseudomonadota bacterium]